MTEHHDPQHNSILIVDDNALIHEDFQKILGAGQRNAELDQLDLELFGEDLSGHVKRAPFHLTHASQGQEALALVTEAMQKKCVFGAAFVDMRMPPGWNGVETIQHLWEVDPDLQVVICTAFSDQSWEEITSQLGRTDRLLILKKPFDEIEVIQIATSLCERRRRLDNTLQIIHETPRPPCDLETPFTTRQQQMTSLTGDLESLLLQLRQSLGGGPGASQVIELQQVASQLSELCHGQETC